MTHKELNAFIIAAIKSHNAAASGTTDDTRDAVRVFDTGGYAYATVDGQLWALTPRKVR